MWATPPVVGRSDFTLMPSVPTFLSAPSPQAHYSPRHGASGRRVCKCKKYFEDRTSAQLWKGESKHYQVLELQGEVRP